MTAPRANRLRRLPVSIALAALLLRSPCGYSDAPQADAIHGCAAAVTVVGSKNACPTGLIEFRIAVTACAKSSGEFDYEYMAVSETGKVAMRRSAKWTRKKRTWTQTENISLACHEGIYSIVPVGQPECTCLAR